jgi:molybdopterin adenylyltransferase
VIRAVIVTISDSVVSGAREDRSGAQLRERAEGLGWQVTAQHAVADERPQIAAKLAELADSGAFSLILTTGGTGIARRDVTPEAARDVIDREIPGIGELMRAQGLKATRMAALSRSLAGTRGKTLIVNLPGSPKGAVESLNAIAHLIPHMVDLLEGRTEHNVPH